MMLSYFQDVVSGVEGALAAAQAGQPIAKKRFTLETARLGTRLFDPQQRVAWCGVMAPFDLLSALGVNSCFVEFVGAMLAGTGGVGPLLEVAEEEGYAPDSCSYHRAVTGAALRQMMPVPDFLIATSSPCTGGLAVIENLARHFQRDLFVIHIPPNRSDESVNQLAAQLMAMVEFVVDHTKRPLDPERLAAAVNATNEMRELLLQTYELARVVPSPARRRDMVNFGIVMSLFLGTPGGVEVARAYRDEFAYKVKNGLAGTADEKIRLLWLQNRIQFKNPVDKLFQEYGATVVVDELNDIDWPAIDPEQPYLSMARRILSVPLTASVARRLSTLKRLAADFGVDGAINPCHWGCRQGSGARGLVEAGLREVGVPVLNLEVDCVDSRQFGEGQIRTRIEAFLELLSDGR